MTDTTERSLKRIETRVTKLLKLMGINPHAPDGSDAHYAAIQVVEHDDYGGIRLPHAQITVHEVYQFAEDNELVGKIPVLLGSTKVMEIER